MPQPTIEVTATLTFHDAVDAVSLFLQRFPNAEYRARDAKRLRDAADLIERYLDEQADASDEMRTWAQGVLTR